MDGSRYMITHSLLSSWSYALKENPFEDATSERDPMADFMATLRREPIPTNEAMQNGIDFEALVTSILEDRETPAHKWAEAGRAVATLLRGAQLQHKASRTVRVSNLDILLYGRLDALKAGVVYDIKFTQNYEAGKYFDSTQHPMYLALVPSATDFTYLASNGTNVWPEHYTREETPDILITVQQFLDWLAAAGLTDTYKAHWEAR
jgi:hypothetical protein